MNKLNLTHLGGLHVYQDTLGFMQDSYDRRILALAGALGNNVIVSGVEVAAGVVSNGWVVLNGELLPFTGGPVGAGWRVMKDTTYEDESFADGAQQQVYERSTARISNLTGVLYSDFFRLETLKSVIGRLNNLIDEFIGHTHTWDEIEDKPAIPQFFFGSYNIGNVTTDNNFLISIPNQGTANYRVMGTLVSQGANWSNDNDVLWMIREKTVDSFRLLTREVNNVDQNLRFEYVIIKS